MIGNKTMAISALKILPYKNSCITKSAWPGKVELNSRVVTPELDERSSLITPNNRLQTVPVYPQEYPVIRISLEKIIRHLKAIAEDRMRVTIGFHPKSLRNEHEIILGKKARILAGALEKKPEPKIIHQALEFLETYEIVKQLERVIKTKRENDFGFYPNPVSNENKGLIEKANYLLDELIKTPDDYKIQLAIDFLETISIINSLEKVAHEKLDRGQLGFHSIYSKEANNEAKLGGAARKLSLALKLTPTLRNKQLAYEFLEMMSQYESSKNENNQSKSKNRCFGFHCSLRGNRNMVPALN